jgi:hypothetical protein
MGKENKLYNTRINKTYLSREVKEAKNLSQKLK